LPWNPFALLRDGEHAKRDDYLASEGDLRDAAEFALELRGTAFALDDDSFRLLYRACEGHTHERNHPDATIQTCWDADRLDLGRVGVMPHPSRLCTDVAKRPDIIKWADGRASFRVVPDFVEEEWGIDVSSP